MLAPQHGQGGYGQAVNAHHVHGKGRGQIVGRNVGQRANGVDHPGIVDKHIQPARLGLDAGNCGIDIGLRGHVQLQLQHARRQGLGRCRPDRPRHMCAHRFREGFVPSSAPMPLPAPVTRTVRPVRSGTGTGARLNIFIDP